LPEQNVALRQHTLFTVTEFHDAIQGMVQTVQTMQANNDSVYSSFRGVPDPSETIVFQQKLSYNLYHASTYLQVRLLSAAVVSALASLTGGDGPRSFFFGDPPSLNYESSKLGDGLHVVDADNAEESVKYDSKVLAVLQGHGMTATFFEAGSAPLSAYLYQVLGDAFLPGALEKCRMPFTNETALELLMFLPPPVFQAVAQEFSQFAVSRSKATALVQERVLAA